MNLPLLWRLSEADEKLCVKSSWYLCSSCLETVCQIYVSSLHPFLTARKHPRKAGWNWAQSGNVFFCWKYVFFHEKRLKHFSKIQFLKEPMSTIVWPQQTVRSSCWSSHRMGSSLQPTHKLRCTRPPQSQSGAIFCHLNHHCVVFKSAR